MERYPGARVPEIPNSSIVSAMGRFLSSIPSRAGAVATTLLLSSGTAQAYCRTMSCELGESAERPCARDAETDCALDGSPIHWPSRCLTYAVQLDGSPKSGLDADQVQELVAQAFERWKSVTCPRGGSPGFDAVFQGFVSCDRQQAVCAPADDNVHTILFHDDVWPSSLAPSAAGVTNPIGSVDSGLLIDADIRLNSANFDFNASSFTALDLSLVLTHEIGHFLGLAHSNVFGALMRANYQDIEWGADGLSDDDVAAICEAYPPLAGPVTCEHSSPAYDECSEDEISATNRCALPSPSASEGGCSVAPAAPLGALGARSFFLGLGALALFGRRRRCGPRPSWP